MVQTPLIVQLYIGAADQVLGQLCYLRATWCWVLHIKKFLRKSTEVMYCDGVFHSGDVCSFGFPMCRNNEYRFRLFNSLGYVAKALDKFIFLDSIHREIGRASCREIE